MTNVEGHFTQDLPLWPRQDKVVPLCHWIDTLRQTVKTAARLTPTDVPQLVASFDFARKPLCVQFRARCLNAISVEIKLRCNLLDLAVQ